MQNFLLPAQKHLDVSEKTDVSFGFTGQKYIENDHTHKLCISNLYL